MASLNKHKDGVVAGRSTILLVAWQICNMYNCAGKDKKATVYEALYRNYEQLYICKAGRKLQNTAEK